MLIGFCVLRNAICIQRFTLINELNLISNLFMSCFCLEVHRMLASRSGQFAEATTQILLKIF